MCLILQFKAEEFLEAFNYIPIYFKTRLGDENIYTFKFGGFTLKFIKLSLDEYYRFVNLEGLKKRVSILRWEEVTRGTSWA